MIKKQKAGNIVQLAVHPIVKVKVIHVRTKSGRFRKLKRTEFSVNRATGTVTLKKALANATLIYTVSST